MTIREIPALLCIPGFFSAYCARCGEPITDFSDPENAEIAIERAGGRLVVSKWDITDCLAACENCKDICQCVTCGALLEDDQCPDCPTNPDT